VRAFRRAHADRQPFGAELPQSTEQVLHFDRFTGGDAPFTVRFTVDSAVPLFEDTFGEFEIAVLRSSLAGINEVPTDLAMGWGGDRLRVYRDASGPALVWVTLFDEPRFAERFLAQIGNKLALQKRPGYRTAVDTLQVGGKSAVRVVVAPLGWARWAALPGVELR
jgi:hypothetical protein